MSMLNSFFFIQTSTVTVRNCNGMSFSPLSYTKGAATNVYWDLKSPTKLTPDFSPAREKAQKPRTNAYGREHIYEIQLSTSVGSASMHLSLRMASSIAVHSFPLQPESNLAKGRALVLQLGRQDN